MPHGATDEAGAGTVVSATAGTPALQNVKVFACATCRIGCR